MKITTIKNNSNENEYCYLNKFNKKNNKSEVFNKRYIDNSYLQMDSKYFEKYKSNIYCKKNSINNLSFGGYSLFYFNGVKCDLNSKDCKGSVINQLVLSLGRDYAAKFAKLLQGTENGKYCNWVSEQFKLINSNEKFIKNLGFINEALDKISLISFATLDDVENNCYKQYEARYCCQYRNYYKQRKLRKDPMDVSGLTLEKLNEDKKQLEKNKLKDGVSEVSTQSFMKQDKVCFSKLDDKFPILLSIHDNLSKIYILNYISEKNNMLDINLSSKNEEIKALENVNYYYNIANVLSSLIVVFQDLTPSSSQTEILTLSSSIVGFIEAAIKSYIQDFKITYLNNLINKRKEYEKSFLSQEESDKILQDLLREEALSKNKKEKNISRKNVDNKVVKSNDNVESINEEPAKKEEKIVENERTGRILTEREFYEDIVDNGDFVQVGFNINNNISSLFLENKITIEHVETEYEKDHERYMASKDLTKFFFKNILSEKNGLNNQIKKLIKDNLSDDNDCHFVGAFLGRLQKNSPNITFLEAIKIFTNIVNNGIILHSNKKRSDANLELYSSEYKLTVPFEVDNKNECIHFKTLLDYHVEKDQKARRVHNPAGDKLAYSTLQKIDNYFKISPQKFYKLTNLSFDELKALYERKYVV